ncbi:MAG: phytanoyl-CoA dioxygenase family protein [Paracoccaceae bacterium]|nr:phytanoyl-CoA dioxygenase family protein [Paracoccaceae bacterium]
MNEVAFFDLEACELDEFTCLTAQSLDPDALSFTDEVVKNVPVYDSATIRPRLADPARRRAVLGEWAWVLGQSAGVLVLKGAVPDHGPLDAATAIYRRIIAREKAGSGGKGDHFATAGANDRIWNSLQKLCEEDPEVFALYFGNEVIAAACEAWLGPAYQVTAQVNLVHPGGKAQEAHRDYHLGFQSAEAAARFPAHAHDLSAVMTLQGAVAHCDMPVESGPTRLLPYSQLYRPGYMSYRREDFRAHFEAQHIQLPLARGDALFFNPALFHAAGDNRSAGIERMANLLQVSSAFGRAMENIDREGMCRRLYPVLQRLTAEGRLTPSAAEAAIAAAAEGYSFPTNLDSDPPVGGLAPETQAALFHRALGEGMTAEAFADALAVQSARRRP